MWREPVSCEEENPGAADWEWEWIRPRHVCAMRIATSRMAAYVLPRRARAVLGAWGPPFVTVLLFAIPEGLVKVLGLGLRRQQ